MAGKKFIFHSNDVIRSFSTNHAKALINKVPWVVTRETPFRVALNRLFDEGFADLLVVEEATGKVTGILSNFDTTTTLSSSKKKEKKANELLKLQEECAAMCDAACSMQGGCKSHGIANYGHGWTCVIECNSEAQTLGDGLDGGQPL